MILVFALMGAELYRRMSSVVPTDVTAYLAAADVFAAGGNPYTTDIALSPRFEGYPFHYLPGVLYLIAPLQYVSARVASVGHLLASSVTLVGSIAYLADRFKLACSRALLVAVTLLFGPVAVALYVGNIPILLLGALLGVVWASDDRERPWRSRLVCGLAGLAITFKPTWAAPAGLALLGRRRWSLLAAFGAGLALPVALTAVDIELARAWSQRLTEVRGNLLRTEETAIMWQLWPVAVGTAAIGAGVIAWRRPESLWIFACAAVFCSPRLTPYSYVMTLPALAYLASRWPPWRLALLVLPIWGPAHWWLRVTSHAWEQWTMYVWALAVAGFTWWELVSDNESPLSQLSTS